jgi:hypothetical protein
VSTTYDEAVAAHEASREAGKAAYQAMKDAQVRAEDASAAHAAAEALYMTRIENGEDVTDDDATAVAGLDLRARAAHRALAAHDKRVDAALAATHEAQRAMHIAREPARRAHHERLIARIDELTEELAAARVEWIRNGNASHAEGIELAVDGHSYQVGNASAIYARHGLREDGYGVLVGTSLQGLGCLEFDKIPQV